MKPRPTSPSATDPGAGDDLTQANPQSNSLHGQNAPAEDGLERELGLKEAVALNMIDMIGIGPFVVSPLVIHAMGGPQALLAWILGAVLALLDGFIWSELGAALPRAGGSYVFLREAYGPDRWGRLMSFLFVWQTLIQAPLVIASGAIGFSQYATYLHPFTSFEQKGISGLVVLVVIALLYRRIRTIGKISVLLWVGVIGTMLWLIAGGITHFDASRAFSFPPGAFHLSHLFFAGLGAAMVSTTYTYWGYYNIALMGGELREPQKNIPRGIFISIGGIAVLYIAMQIAVLGVVPWQEAQYSPFLVSTFVEKISGPVAARVATSLVLWIAFASIFAGLLGYSRVPYAAALDGSFFSVFARVHPQKKFPYVSLLFLGGVAFVCSLLFKLSTVIAAILATRLLVQFIGQAVGIMLLHKRWPPERFPFKMWLYPLPAVLTMCGWAALFWATGAARKYGLLLIALGLVAFLLRAREVRQWPFAARNAAHPEGA
jgi:fructoselysine transporter